MSFKGKNPHNLGGRNGGGGGNGDGDCNFFLFPQIDLRLNKIFLRMSYFKTVI